MKKFLKKLLEAIKKIWKMIIRVVKFTYEWLKNEVKKRLDKKKIIQVVIVLLKKLLKKCENTESYDELKKLVKKKNDVLVWADVKKDGEIKNIEIFENEKKHMDEKVRDYLSKDKIAVIEE